MNAKLPEEINTVGWPAALMQNHVFECHEEIRTMRARIAELDRDKERLDWLEKSAPNMAIDHSFWAAHMPNAGQLIIHLHEMDDDCEAVIDELSSAPTVRAAIDAAMGKEDKP